MRVNFNSVTEYGIVLVFDLGPQKNFQKICMYQSALSHHETEIEHESGMCPD